MLRTGGFDMVGEINKRFLNRLIGILFYKGFLTIKGVYTVSSQGIPGALTDFTDIKYKISLKDPPNINLVDGGKLLLLTYMDAVFTILGGLELDFDVALSLKADFSFNHTTNRFFVDIAHAQVDSVEINDRHNLPKKVINKFNEIISIVVTQNLVDQYTDFNVPLVLYLQELPLMPSGNQYEMDVEMGGVKTFNDKVLAAAVNLLGYTGGNIADVTNFSNNNDLAIGISEAAMHRVFDFWWANTIWPDPAHPKSITTSDVKEVDGFVDFLNHVADVYDLLSQLASLGFLETDIHVDRIWVEYGATVTFQKPDFDLQVNNKISLTGKVDVHAWAKGYATVTVTQTFDSSSIIPDGWTPWEDDITLYYQTNTYTLFDLTADIDDVVLTGTGNVELDPLTHNIIGRITSATVSVELNDWYDFILNPVLTAMSSFINNFIIDHVPPIVLFPTVVTTNIPNLNTPITMTIDMFKVYDEETIIAANFTFSEMTMAGILLPSFVANNNPDSMEVHRLNCKFVEKMNEEHKVAYYVLNDALDSGYDGCKVCLPEYDTR